MSVSNLSTDPLGRNLPSCFGSSPKRKTAPKKKASPPPKKKPAPAAPPPNPYMFAQVNMFEQVKYYQVAPPPPPPKKEEKKKPKSPAQVCAKCSAKEKCKACKKKEDAKKWVYKPNFWQPRQPPKSVFAA